MRRCGCQRAKPDLNVSCTGEEKEMPDQKGIWLKVREKGPSSVKKPRVYFTCHPEDFEKYFDEICEHILRSNNCAIYYAEDMSASYQDEDWRNDLEQMNLFVIPVTFLLLRGGNRALDIDLHFAVENHIPVLPLMMENGLDDLFMQHFGKIQYLSPDQADETAISFEEKLDSYLEGVLLGDEVRKRVQAAFDAYIFLSYRKKDRKYANELMRLIHKNPLCRDIAIWYDEFLVPGEDFNESIAQALEKCSLFTLMVTPNLLEDQNYVMRIEYPEAKKAGKEILPVEMVPTDSVRMSEKYVGIPISVKGRDDDEFRARFLEGLKGIATHENELDPAHNFLVGLAYLDGIDVEKDHERALELITSAAESYLPEAMEKLAGMYEDAEGVDRNYAEEIKWREKLLERAEKEPAPKKNDLIRYMHTLANAYVRNGKYKKALPLYERLYEIRKESAGEEDSSSLVTLMNVAVTYGKLGMYKKDLELEKQIYLKWKAKYGPETSTSLTLLGNIAFCYGALGNYKKETELNRIVYERYKKLYGEDHPDTLLALKNVGASAERLGDHLRAISALEKVYEELKKIRGPEHPDTLSALSSLAVSCGALGDVKKELELENEVYKIRCSVLGEEHPSTLISLSNLAVTYGENGDTAKEAELEEKLYESRKKVLGEDHPQTLGVLNNLSVTYGDLGNYEKASGILEKVYELRKRTLGDEHPDTLVTLGNLAYAYGKTGDFRKEAELEEKVYEAMKRNLGEDHPETKVALKNLAYTYESLGENEKAEELRSRH